MSGCQNSDNITYSYAACDSVVRSPVGLDGMAHPMWAQNYVDQRITDAISLDWLHGCVQERGANAPSRDEGYQPLIIEQHPVLTYPEPVTRQSDAVQTIWDSQVNDSCGLDIGRDQLYVSSDYVVYCANKST